MQGTAAPIPLGGGVVSLVHRLLSLGPALTQNRRGQWTCHRFRGHDVGHLRLSASDPGYLWLKHELRHCGICRRAYHVRRHLAGRRS